MPFSQTIQAIAIANSISLLATGAYTISAPTPTIFPAATVIAGASSIPIAYGSGFNSSGLKLNGATIVGNALQLTDGGGNEGRTAWFTTPVNIQTFTTDFTFQQTSANADGFTFTLQNAPAGTAAVGANGGYLGYAGIGSSVAVKFDLYNNMGEGVDSTGFYSGGNAPFVPSLDMTSSGVNLHSGHIMHAHLAYDGTTLTLTLTDTMTSQIFTASSAINIPALVGGTTAYAGFTAGTGGLAAIQNILSWTYKTSADAPTFSPADGTYAASQPITIDDTTVGASIYYTTDGTIPTTTSTRYTAPLNVTASETLKAIAIAPGFFTSSVSASSYVIANASSIPIAYGSGFNSSGLKLNGATIVGNALQLTDGGGNEGRTAWFTTPVNIKTFTTDFTFQQTSANADGFTFTLQNAPAGTAAVGANGGYLGYAGIGSSVAVKFDLYNNVGEGVNSTGFYSGGTAPFVPSLDMTLSGVNLHSGHIMHAHLAYDGTNLALTLTDTMTGQVFTAASAINIPALVGGTTAYAGFTAGTGGLAAMQNILSWTYAVTSPLSLTLTPETVSLTPLQTQQFIPAITGNANTAVNWTLSPAVGSISAAGLYTAPATILATQTVTVTATSAADSTKKAGASISLVPPVVVSLTPGGVNLTPLQTQQFTPAVTGTANTAVAWTLSPAVGSISAAGLYTAPATILAAQTVTVTATSAADSTKKAGASISLVPPVVVSLTPGGVNLTPLQTQQFTPAVTGTANTAVAWTLSPAVGSISAAGLYTAPAKIAAAQTVTITATSVADSTKTISAAISLVPAVSVAVTPGGAILKPSQTQQFTATVANAANTGVNWTLSPAMGTLSPGGLYTAPAAIGSAQTVTVTATSAADPTKTASAAVSLVPAVSVGRSYYLSPSGNDSNDGATINTAWLTPNHSVNCGDVIVALAGSNYSASSFGSGKWGNVTCGAGNNVAWLKCVSFDACKLTVTSGTTDAMRVSSSYWGVQGWEISNIAGGGNGGNCLDAVPASSTLSIHHIIFANNIVSVCPLDGISMGPNGTAGVDYWAAVGNIVYRAGVSSTWCGSGISAYEPVATDNLPGTHIYVAGNFSYSNTNPAGCYDGNGIIFDTFDGDQTGMLTPYSQQAVIDNNISVSNGARGVLVENNNAGAGASHAHIYVRHNTTWNNDLDTFEIGSTPCGEITLYHTLNTEAYSNIAATYQNTCYGGAPTNHAFTASGIDGTNHVYGNVGWDSLGSYSLISSSTGFIFDPTNLFGMNPSFVNPTTPSSPSCGNAVSTSQCMASLVANFSPANTAIQSYGYQVPTAIQVSDPLFPQWLCNVNLPTGLVTPGCLAGNP